MRRFFVLVLTVLLMVCGAVGGTSPARAEDAPNGYPYCATGSATDPDGDGWGWENSRSCVVRGGPADGNANLACPSGMRCGSETVSGLGSRKQQARGAGATSLDLAVAMLETTTMTTNYPYGDNKTGDAANFGIFKQNWLMLRSACGQFRNQSTSQWNNGAALNNNLSADISCLHQSQNHYGITRWFAGHRNGESGLNNPDTGDINGYKAAIYWIQNQINSNSANLGNNTRFWVDVRPI